MTVNLSMLAGAGAQFFDNSGVPLAGGLVYTYAAGTTTPQATYTTSAGSTAHANPIVLDSAGRTPSGGEIWLTDAVAYKFVLKTSAAVTIATYDNVTGNASGIISSLAASSGSSLVGFIQSGTGAVATTVQTKLRESVSVLDFGADPTGATNSQTFIANALTYCKTNGKSLYIPGGTYLHSAVLDVDSVTLFGDGVTSILKATSATDTAIRLIGTGPEVQGIFVTGTATAINANVNSCGVAVYQATNFIVTNVTVDKTPYFGIGVFASSNGSITFNNVYGALKDGIHLTNDTTTGSSYVDVIGNYVGANGDDGIAVVTYSTASICTGINIVGNIIKNSASRAINLAGAALVTIANNNIISPTYAGINIIQDSVSGTLGSERILVDSNVIDTAGSASPNLYGAINLASAVSGQPVARVIISNNIVSNSRKSAIYTTSAEVFNVNINNNILYASGNCGIELNGGYNYYIESNQITTTVSSAVLANSGVIGEIIIRSNYLKNVGSNNASTVFLIAATTPGIVEISSNTHNNTAAYTITRFINVTANSSTIFNNQSTATYANSNIIPAPASFFASSFAFNNTTVSWTYGTGSPEAVVTAGIGSLYSNVSGGVSTTLYVKTSGTGNTGWTAK